MKNRRRKRKHITPQRPVISESIDSVESPFIHNLLCIMLPKEIFQGMEHYAVFVNKVIEDEGLPVGYGTLHQYNDDPNRVALNVKSDPHSHKEQYCYYSHTLDALKSPPKISRENAIAELIPETSTAFTKEHINSPEVQSLDILTVDQLQRLWKKLVHSRTAIDNRASGRQIRFDGDVAFLPFRQEDARIMLIEEIDEGDGICDHSSTASEH